MTQHTPTIAANQSGVDYRTQDNSGKKAILNHHKGSIAPSYAEAGIIWLDDAATPWLLKIYDGADWIVLGAVNATANTVESYHGASGLRIANHAADTGAANAYVVAPSPSLTAYAAGQIVMLKPANASTGAATINVSALGVKSIKLLDGANPAAGALATTGVYALVYDGTNFVLLNPSLGSAAYLNAGTASNQVVQLTAAAKLPAVDGSLLTNLSAGALVFLSSATASNSASVVFAGGIDSTYDEYIFEISDVIPVTDGQDLYMTFSTDGGSSYLASNYAYAYAQVVAGNPVGQVANGSMTQIKVTDTQDNAAGCSASLQLRLYNPAGTSVWKKGFLSLTEFQDTASVMHMLTGAFANKTTSAINAVKFAYSSGNISSGKFYLYGVKKS